MKGIKMKQLMKRTLQLAMFVPAFALCGSLLAAPTYAAPACDASNIGETGLSGSADCAKGTGQSEDLTGESGVFRTVTNILLFIIGAVAVIMLVIGGIRYTISGGDSNQVTAAKNTILYAIIGIVVAILAFAAVNFVLNSFGANA